MHDSTKAVSYQSIIPILIESIKEQQVQIETLKKIIVAHEEEIIQLKKHHENGKASLKSTTTTDIYSNVDNSSNALLFQNKPNPFTVDTEINYNIPIDAKNAFIYIHDLQGIEIKSYCIKDNGAGSIVIKGTELKAGMYVYSLLVNNQIIDTKRMILTQN